MNKLGWNTRSVPDIFTQKWGWPLIKVTMKLPFPQKTYIEQQRREQWGDYRNPPPPPQTTVREFTDTGGPTARCQRKSQLSLSDKILIGVKSHMRPTTAERLAAWQLSVLPLSTTQIPPLYRIGCPAAWLAILLARSHCWLTILRMLLYHLTSPSLVPAFTLTAPTHPQWLLTSIEANLFRLLAEVVNYITDILKSSLSIPAVSSVV